MKTYTTNPFVEGYVFLEGPRWHKNRLWVSDIWAHRVYAITEDGTAEVAVEVPGRPSGLGFMPDGTPLIVSMTDRCVYKLIGGALELHADLSGTVRADINDMVVAPNGRAYVGNMGYDLFAGAEPELAEISLIEPDGSHRIVADRLEFPNGMVITSSGATLVVSESFGEKLSAFDITADGSLRNRRVYAELPGLVPDGICLDVDGNIWVAGASGGAFVQVDRSGEIIARIETKDEAAIACQLGGADGRTLYCLIFTGGIDDIKKGNPGARIETVTVESAAAGSP
ncbi:MAG: sugar lactone lactonase YvrE [Gammaproteobacteria bacterium]|jgi:sugar lactone lactonase YvrE